jgi:hypothetical protein
MTSSPPPPHRHNKCTSLNIYFWGIENFVIKSDILGDFSFVKIFLKNYRVTMITPLNTSCSENTMVLSARRGVSACMYFLVYNIELSW